jgi:hypoxanthine phosphoribosyltransferase
VKQLLSEAEIGSGVQRLAQEINAFYSRRPLTIVGVLTGSIVFAADLVRKLNMPLRVGVVQARSYRGRDASPGPLVINTDLLIDVRGRDVLLVDDIFDTGNTLFELTDQLDALSPRSVRSAVLLRKQGRRQVRLDPDHVGFDIPDVFVVGYGLDYDDRYRNLPYLASLEPDDLRLGSEQAD